MGVLMFGVGIGGIGTTILRATTLAIWPVSKNADHNEFYGVIAYSIVCGLINVLCALG